MHSFIYEHSNIIFSLLFTVFYYPVFLIIYVCNILVAKTEYQSLLKSYFVSIADIRSTNVYGCSSQNLGQLQTFFSRFQSHFKAFEKIKNNLVH
jgi:hypothetical protein